MTHELKVAWAAGLFEGEGSFSVATKRRGERVWSYATASLTTTDEDVIRRFAAIVGGRVYGPYKRGADHWKPQWYWSASNRASFAAFVLLVRPFLGERRRERLAAVEAQAHATRRLPGPREECRNGHPLTPENRKPNGKGKVACRACARERDRKRYAASHA